jgi:nickel transport protein
MTTRVLSVVVGIAAFLAMTAGDAVAQNAPAAAARESAAGDVSGATAAPLPAGIEKALEKALDKKLAPILRTLAEMQEQKVRPTDVLGGLGYIFGLVGVAAYVKARGKGSRT